MFHTSDGRKVIENLDEFDDAREVVAGLAAEYQACERPDYVSRYLRENCSNMAADPCCWTFCHACNFFVVQTAVCAGISVCVMQEDSSCIVGPHSQVPSKDHTKALDTLQDLPCICLQIERARGGDPGPFTSAASDSRIAAH